MKYLIDTSVVIRWLNGEKISPQTLEILSDKQNILLVSSITVFEIELKKTYGRLNIPDRYYKILQDSAFTLLSLTSHHAREAARLPLRHKDPFDRMIIAQAKTESAIMITTDVIFAQYDIPVLRA